MTHNVEVDFSNMGDKIDLTSSKLVSHLQFCDKLVSIISYKISFFLSNNQFKTFLFQNLTARLLHANTNISNSDYDYNGQKSHLQKHENNLPGVVIILFQF